MADWNTPTLSSLYTDFLSYMKDRDVDIAKQFDGTTSTNVPTGAVKWNSTSNRWNKWDGSAWQELTTSYGFNSVTLPNGTANGVAYLNGSKVLTSGSALTFDGTNLGVGTSSPSAKLNVYGGAFDAVIKLANATSGNTGSDGFDIAFTGANVYFANRESGFMAYEIAGSEQMRLTSTGLGIGTSSPAQKLDVAGSGQFGTASTNSAVVRYFNQNANLYIGVDSAAGSNTGIANAPYFMGTGAYPMTFWTNTTERMRLDSSGNLGLGVTPSAWGSSYRSLQVGNSHLTETTGYTFLGQNWYVNSGGTTVYTTSNFATLYRQNSGQHVWFTAPSGTAGGTVAFTQAMTLDASGNLGIGTSSPNAQLHVSYAGQTGIQISNTGSTPSSWLTQVLDGGSIRWYSYTAGSERMRIDSSGNVGIGTSSPSSPAGFAKNETLYDASSCSMVVNSGGVYRSEFAVSSGGGWLGTYDSIPQRFVTANIERMRIDSSGNLLVGTASVNTVGGGYTALNIAGSSGGSIVLKESGGTRLSYIYGDASNRLYCTQNTNGVYLSNGATSWAAASDERVKDIIEPIEDAASKVSTLRAVIGKYKTDEEGTRRSFLIAQDLQKVLPEAVDASDPEKLGVQYTDVIPLLVAAIQELKAELDATKAEVAALKGA